jgi:hypothetical protein
MNRSRFSTPLLLGILLGSLMPVLYLVQWALQRGDALESWLNGTLKVSVEGQEPLILPINLHQESSEKGLTLQGTATLQDSKYPWKPVPFEATFWLHLDSEIRAPGNTGAKLEWAASYSERLLSRTDGLGIPPLPCKGSLERTEWTSASNPQSLGDWSELALAVNLTCTSAGSDLLWSSGDERVWTIQGPLALSQGPRP